MICHETPNLSLSQPQGCFSPPSESLSQSSSTSSWVSQSTKSEMPWAKLKEGPPFSAMNSCPASSNVADMNVPAGAGPASPYRLVLRILESSKTEV